jgi:3-oxoisoapionate decarboxylase
MKLGLDQYSYHRFFGEIYGAHPDPGVRWSLHEFLVQADRLPIEALSLESCFLPGSDIAILNEISGLKIPVSFAWGHPNGFMNRPQPEIVQEIERYLQLSREIHSGVLRIAGSSIQFFDAPHRPQIEAVMRALDGILPLAEKHGVRLALENHGDFFVPEIMDILGRLDSPFLGVTLDTGNLIRLKEDPVEAIRIFGSRIFIVHAKDLAPIPGKDPGSPFSLACVPAGMGITDFPGIFAALHTINYQGTILIEISGVHPDFARMDETEMIRKGLSHFQSITSREII